MGLVVSSNPAFSNNVFNKNFGIIDNSPMTIEGTVNKFGFLLLLVMTSAIYTWHSFSELKPDTTVQFMMIGGIGGFICAFAMIFKPNWSPYVAPAYGILEGFLLGGLSAILNEAFSKSYPGLITQAVGLTFGVAVSMFALYSTKVITVTNKLRSGIILATVGIAIFYTIMRLLSWFGVSMPFMYDSSMLGIGISLFVVGIAAFNLLLDFDNIERGAANGSPKYMEWYGAFGLLVTLVWLYLEILKLMIRLSNRK